MRPVASHVRSCVIQARAATPSRRRSGGSLISLLKGVREAFRAVLVEHEPGFIVPDHFLQRANA